MPGMTKIVQDCLRRVFKIEVHRTSLLNQKEAPIPLIRLHALRMIHLYNLLKRISEIPGNIVECGVGWGRSLYALCLLEQANPKGRSVYGFDSFEGFPEPSEEDEYWKYGIKKGRYKTNPASVIRHLLKSGISQEFIREKVNIVKGYFCDSLHKYGKAPIALLHLDVDLYLSYKECLEYFYPLVVRGGIIAFDEYQSIGMYSGCKKAVDEYLNGREEILKSEIIDRYYVVKK